MKRYRLSDLMDVREGPFLQGLVAGEAMCRGGLGFKQPGQQIPTGYSHYDVVRAKAEPAEQVNGHQNSLGISHGAVDSQDVHIPLEELP